MNWFVLGFDAEAVFGYQTMSRGENNMKKLEAVLYLEEVRMRFEDKEKFVEFLEIINDYRVHRLDQVEQHFFLQFFT